MEKGDHIVALVYHKSMNVAWWFEQIAAGGCDPVAFEAAPLPFNYEAVDGCRVTMARDNSGFRHFSNMDPVSLADVEA